jgi:5-methylcytosine-specific restriction enzyme A
VKQSRCAYPACGRLTSTRFCDHHQAEEAAYNARQAQGAGGRWEAHHEANPLKSRLYRSREWRAIKARLLALPCALCGGKATSVDHIDNGWTTIEEGLREGNLRPLCKRCHDRKSQGDSRRK